MTTTSRRAFLKYSGFAAATLFAPLRSSLFAQPTAGLPRATPESQGMPSSAILSFLDAVATSKHEFHSFILARHGNVVAEGWWDPYKPALNHWMYSMSKSFTSTAIGFAAAEGKLTVEDPVAKFFPEDLPAKPDANLARLKVKHLLTMSVGHSKDSLGSVTVGEDWVKNFLSLPIPNDPGTQFLYNSGATYMLSAIIQKLTGQKLLDYLTPRLFAPLGIEGMTWQSCPRGIHTGGWGLAIQTEGLARFGQLYLQNGQWNGKQILPKSWIEEATTFKIQQPLPAKPPRPNDRNDWLQGYCYQFWRCTHNAYRGDGAFGQFTIVMPEQDAVLAITSESPSMQGQLDLVWEHLLPAMKNAPIAEDKPAAARLAQALSSLKLPIPAKGKPTSPLAASLSGKTFTFSANDARVERCTLTFTPDGANLNLKDSRGDHAVTAGLQKWSLGETDLAVPALNTGRTVMATPKTKSAASAQWLDDNTFELTCRFIETPHHDTFTFAFDADKVTLRFLNSIAAMNPARKDARPAVVGQKA